MLPPGGRNWQLIYPNFKQLKRDKPTVISGTAEIWQLFYSVAKIFILNVILSI
jgi:hypothetical protein